MVWGNTSKGLPWSSIQAGSQTTYAHTRANYATGMDLKKKLQEVAAKTKGGSPEGYDTGAQGVIRKGGGLAMTWAQAAEAAIKLGGIYDGTETPKEINAMTKAAAAAHKGRGLMGVARDNLPRDGQTYGFMAGIRGSRSRRRDRRVDHRRFHGRRRRRHRDSPELARRPDQRRQHPGHRSRPQPEAGLRPALRRGPVRRACTTTSRRRFSTCRSTRSGRAVGLPDPTNPVGAKGIGEPSTVAAAGAVLNALADAVGDDIIRRTPVQPEHIAAALANGRKPMMRQPASGVHLRGQRKCHRFAM